MSTRWTIAIHRCRGHYARVILAFFSAILWSAHNSESHAARGCKTEVARIVSIQGVIELRRAQETHWQHAGLDEGVCAGDSVRARSHSRAALRLSNDSMLRLDQKTSLSFAEIQAESSTSLLDLLEGAIHIITRTPRPFKIRTPFVNASVEGTEFLVGLEHDAAKVVVYEGKVLVSNEVGSIRLHDHEAAVALNGQVPRKEIIIRPTDAVHWALHYPAILDNWADKTPKAESAAAGLIRQAGRLLIVGQADEARAIIDQALELQPGNSDAYALLAIIAVTQNDKDQALDLATQAAVSEQRSAAAYLAISYAQQAHFDINAALESVQKASALEPENALIWARLAELRMSVGDLDRSLEAAQHAVRLDPYVAKTNTVLGFAHLLQIDTQSAKTSFTQAITLDQADPMPRLGLGIALIREGELEAGRVELEIAASLDPANSLIRSYLGKVYFEEKRYSLASTQFDLAKERDPKDPTPWFYDAIQKQTQNRPVEALRDIQKSIELNDNRAVYRSKFLLDRDEAARGSSLARIFENLGFERRAVMETAKSLSFDPANHSAHRFLSDTYANTPRHEAARVSELLQAQLLQPINVNPVQPHMAVADLNIITGTSPSAVGFNEFAPLMERNKPQVVASGITGSNSTFGNEIVASILYDRASISLGQFHYQTSGFRPNSHQNINVYNAFMQFSLTPKLNVQAEFRALDGSYGDIRMDFRRDGRPDYHRTLNENVARFGARYSLSPNQDLIFSGKYIDREVHMTGTNPNSPEPSENFAHSVHYGLHFETQYLFRQKNFNSVMGGGSYEFDGINNKIKRNNYYIYINTLLPWNLTVSTGLSYDVYGNFANADDKYHNNINPKFGLQWDITDKLRLRGAWFETTKAHLIAQQSLEPTQVAGFNQFLDDLNGARSRRMGIGVDYRFTDIVFAGVEASARKFDLPSDTGPKREEQLYRAYLYWIPHVYWVTRGEFQYENYEIPWHSPNNQNPQQLQTLRMPFSIEYFHPNGLFSKFATTLVHQNLRLFKDLHDNQRRDPYVTNSGINSFLLLDLALGYRFAKRRGLLSLEGKNLLDENFFYMTTNFYDSEERASLYVPERMFFLKLTFNF